MNTLAESIWTPNGFVAASLQSPNVAAVQQSSTKSDSSRWALPGLCNAHSHAFQRAMAGLTERQTHADDSFWTWRETMYRFAGVIGPDELQAIAAQLYVEMLEAGYTSVCEFHYLHHQPDGRAYADAAAMSHALIAAARETGIRMTLLPVLYLSGGFDGRALSSRQQRFGHRVDAFARLLEVLRHQESDSLTVGMALHSLRAVPPQALTEILQLEAGHTRPIHIHIAEQIPEVEDCLALRGVRPVAWLMDHADVDARWTLVHATHLDDYEIQAIARSQAVVALCPTTEANLGDGLFPLRTFLDAAGRIAIGSDSHVSVSPVEELRWLEYGQRLQALRRNVAVSAQQASVGENLFARVLEGGQQSAGHGMLARESLLSDAQRSGFVVLDDQHPILAARSSQQVLDTWLFSGNVPLVRDVVIDGQWLVRDGEHRDRARIANRYRHAVSHLNI